MKLFDKDQKGYLDFKTFANAVHPNMSCQINTNKKELHLPNLVPSKAKCNEYGNKASNLKQAFAETKRGF